MVSRVRSAGFEPGFRLSMLDLFVLFVAAAGSGWLGFLDGSWGFAVAFVVAHFFLFCNVFRIARPLELAWAGMFVLLAAGTILGNVPGWPTTTAVMLTMTVIVVSIEMRKPSYHGIAWQRINPGLPAWWTQHGPREISRVPEHVSR